VLVYIDFIGAANDPAIAQVSLTSPNVIMNLAFGFFAAMLSGYLAVSLVFKLIQKAKLRFFSFYLFALAAFVGIDTYVLAGKFFG
jgi:undecaprenyl pyrophosphate phosphatase UppP